MKFVNCYILIVAATFSAALYAGPTLSTRADVIILPDDSVVLADPFIDAQATQDGGGPLLQLLNPRIYQTIALYQKVSSTAPFKSGDIDNIFNNLLSKRTKLRFFGLESAEEMNKYCFAGRPVYTIPSGASVQQAACTKGNDTFIVKPLFLRLSIRDQAMLLIHERLTTIADDRGWINFVAVAKYTTGLNTFLNVYNEQARRMYRELTDLEQKNIYNFYNAIVEITNRNADYGSLSTFNWNVHKNGGGLTHINSFVDASAFVSLSSVIAEKSELQANSKVINLTFKGGTNNPYYAIPLKLAENSKIETFNTGDNRDLLIGTNSSIRNSYFNAETIRIGDNVSISDTTINAKTLVLKNGVVFERSQVVYQSTDFAVAENQKLIDQIIKPDSAKLYYPAGVIPRPYSVTVKVPTFKCIQTEKAEKKSWEWSSAHTDEKGDGLLMSGWTTYNGRNGLKKEFEYVYSDTKLVVSYKNFDRAPTPVVYLNEKGELVTGDYLRKGQFLNLNFGSCFSGPVTTALGNVGIILTNQGYKIPLEE